ncbi:MAG TPA: hypothetical protein VFW07_25505 [Parafilimonas sp.]|nr:hypothetical protein [Parafilimonas sp.]
MKNLILTNRYAKIFIRIFSTVMLAAFILMIVQSCGKEDTTQPGSETVNSSDTDSAIATTITKKQALARLNEHFKNEFSPITMQQVVGVTKQQFSQWLRNSVMAPAEDMYLKPLLQSGGLQFVIIKNVTVLANGKKANIGLIATTPKFYSQYTRMVTIVGYTNIHIGQGHICSWKRCDSYSPCPCINWLDIVYGECPTDRCQFNSDCNHYNPATDCDGELTGITTYDAIEVF